MCTVNEFCCFFYLFLRTLTGRNVELSKELQSTARLYETQRERNKDLSQKLEVRFFLSFFPGFNDRKPVFVGAES